MNPFADVAQRLYGGAGDEGATTVSPGRAADHGAPDAAVERILYGDNALPDVNLSSLQDLGRVPSEQRAEGSRRFRESLHQLGIDTAGARILATRVAGRMNEPLDEDGMFRLNEESKFVLKREFGDSLDQELRAMNKALERHPQLRDLLHASGAGADADVVRELLHGLRRARARG